MIDDSSTAQVQLLCRIAARDKLALAELYDQVAGVLFATAVRILGDSHEAEEVIQDAFVQIWSRAETFDSTLGKPVHWAIGIVRNRSIDRLRSRQRRARMMDELQVYAVPEVSDGSGPMQAGLAGEELAAVRAAVDGLPLDQRRALEMAFFGGLTHVEIAQQLNEPLGTVKARIRRGMLKLRDSLQSYT